MNQILHYSPAYSEYCSHEQTGQSHRDPAVPNHVALQLLDVRLELVSPEILDDYVYGLREGHVVLHHTDRVQPYDYGDDCHD